MIRTCLVEKFDELDENFSENISKNIVYFDGVSAEILSGITNKSVALKYIRRLPKKAVKAAPKKKAAAKKAEEPKGDE